MQQLTAREISRAKAFWASGRSADHAPEHLAGRLKNAQPAPPPPNFMLGVVRRGQPCPRLLWLLLFRCQATSQVAGFLPLGALTPCNRHDASQKLEPDDCSGRRLCLCCGSSSEVPKGQVCGPEIAARGRQRGAGWGWGWVLNPIAVRQSPAVGRPQTPDFDLPFVSAFVLQPFSRNLGLGRELRGQDWRPGRAGTAWASFPKWSLPTAAHTQLLLLSGCAF